MHIKLNLMKLKSGLGSFYVVTPSIHETDETPP